MALLFPFLNQHLLGSANSILQHNHEQCTVLHAHAGDIVICTHPVKVHENIIKRVTAVSGDTVSVFAPGSYLPTQIQVHTVLLSSAVALADFLRAWVNHCGCVNTSTASCEPVKSVPGSCSYACLCITSVKRLPWLDKATAPSSHVPSAVVQPQIHISILRISMSCCWQHKHSNKATNTLCQLAVCCVARYLVVMCGCKVTT